MEIRLHGRGGQGAAMASGMLAAAFFKEGKYACGFPMFGFERRGAPVTSFVRVSDTPIREKTMIYNPDCLIILDTAQLYRDTTFKGFRPNGTIVVNISKVPEKKPHENIKVLGVVDATKIAMEEIGIPAINTCILGAFAATTKLIKLETLLSVLKDYFSGKILDKNLRSVERGYKETQVIEY